MHNAVYRLTALSLLSLALLASPVKATSIHAIKGDAFLSPLHGQNVHDVCGIVAAKDRYGIWLIEAQSDDERVSNGLRVYGLPAGLRAARSGDKICLSGVVASYRQAARPDDLILTELISPANVVKSSSGHKLIPVVLGRDRIPPTAAMSSLDQGPDGWLSVPNNRTRLDAVNATLEPDLYGLDFWQSLEGQLVTIPSPVSVGLPDYMGSFWVHGDWPVQGKNSRGGLTLAFGEDGLPYAHSEAIQIGRPLDGSRIPKSAMGMRFEDIIGIVTYQFGFYRILPLTAPSVLSVPQDVAEPASITSGNIPCEITIGDYNVENMSPRSHHIAKVADHIANYLHAPDIMFLQEIQSDSGSANNGIVSANKTLSALVNAIAKAGGGVEYEFINIPPEDNQDGGKPGSNIRVAYLWRPERVSLVEGSRIGTAVEATSAILDKDGQVALSLNPGRVEPNSSAWEETRKPLAAAWQTVTGERFFTVNVHLSSKRDSSSSHGNPRPPVNGHSDRRTHQVNVTADFIESILAKNINASVVLAGDMNEYVQTRSVFSALVGLVLDINEVSGVPPLERYTYVYEQRTQEIDHIFVSEAISRRGTEVEHVHVNTWAHSTSDRASDHDPTIAKVRVCDAAPTLYAMPVADLPSHRKLVVQDHLQ